MSICIQYSRPASSQDDNEIFGFDVAVKRFLSAYFRYGKADKFLCRPSDEDSFDHFKEMALAEGIGAERCIGLDPRYPDKNLQSIDCLFRPDPLTADLVWRRPQVPGQGYATCGLVHTMSGQRIARAVEELYFAPSDSIDALICPSNAIRDAVRTLWDTYGAYVKHRFGAVVPCPVQTPVIPLGIDSKRLSTLSDSSKRAVQRQALGVAEDEVVILFVGRLSFATKAHPYAMFAAAERAANVLKKKVRLVLFGYFKPKDMEPHFRDLAAGIGKTVKIEFVMNNDPRFPDGLWAAADIFTSLSDNVQESFGLTPIEAMASGLPSVVADWDGYREGVRNGEEGFLIPTMTPPPSAGLALAKMYYNEDNYGVALSGASQSTSVDIDWCARSYAVLISNSDLRRKFGENGRKRAREVFDWRHVIKAYEDFWRSLSEQRLAKQRSSPLPECWQAANPGYPNPWHMFKSFPTTHLALTDIVRIAMEPAEVEGVVKHRLNLFVPELLLPKDQLLELIAVIRRAQAVRIQDVLAAFPKESHDLLWRCLGWMLKLGICSFERPQK